MKDLDKLDDGYTKAAAIETWLMVEWLSDERPDPDDAVWVGNVPAGPDPKGIHALQVFQTTYGSVNVTTGNPRPLAGNMGQIGIYIRDDVLEPDDNFLRAYLAQ